MIDILPTLYIVLAFIIVLTIAIKMSNKKQEERIDDFWDREKKANLTQPVDISQLPYLNIPIEKFYFGSLDDPNVKEIEDKILALSKKPLLNLAGKTNTELKETYGSPNLEAMKAIGEDFDNLTMALVSYAEALYNAGCITEAITVLEYGVFIKSDISKNYTLLADCFIKMGQPRRIETLREQVLLLHLLMEPSILNHFDELLSSTATEPEDFEV